MTNISRKELVERLIRFDSPLAPTQKLLAEFGWDCDEPLVKLEPTAVCSILDRYLSGELSALDVEAWADAVECREDIEGANVKEIIFELASPSISRQLTPEVANELKQRLKKDAV